MTAPILARWVITHRAPCVLVRGRDAGRMLRRYQMKPLWSATGRGWVVDDELLPDVAAIAGLVTLGYRIVHEDDSECECASLRAARRELGVDPSDDSLCVCGDLDDALARMLTEELGAVEVGHVHRVVTR